MVVARDDNLALDGNTHALELLVVLRNSVVDIDERGSHVAVDRVSIIGGELLGLLIRGEVLRKCGFLEFGDKLRAPFDELNEAFPGRGKENFELLDVGIETELLEFCGDPFGVVLVVGRTDVVRARGKTLHVGAQIVRAGKGAELLFPLALRPRRFGGVTEQRLLVGDYVTADRSKREAHKENGCNSDGTVHCSPRMERVFCLKASKLKMRESELTITPTPPYISSKCGSD